MEGLPNRRSSGELRRKEQCRQGKGHGSVSAFGGTFLRDGLRAFSDRLPELPREWADSCTSDDHVLNLTAEEMCLMIEELNEVVRRWQIKAGMHGDDEPGAEPVALILQAFRWFS